MNFEETTKHIAILEELTQYWKDHRNTCLNNMLDPMKNVSMFQTQVMKDEERIAALEFAVSMIMIAESGHDENCERYRPNIDDKYCDCYETSSGLTPRGERIVNLSCGENDV